MTRNALIIEDSHDIGRLISLHLRDIGCETELVHDGRIGLDRATSRTWSIIILDLMLPGLDGLELCRRLRAGPDCTPILMLTAKSSEVDRVVGLEVGADDYLTKPFSMHELQARAKAIFRRAEAFAQRQPDRTKRIAASGLIIDAEKRSVSVAGSPVQLTAKEFDLLLQFASHPGRVFSRQQLLDLVWGHGYAGYDHTVNSHINRLRAKIERDPAKPDHVLTVWGVGYKFNDHSTA